jgi:hypothetical protein
VFTEAQLAKTNEAKSNIVVTWFFMALLDAKFRGHGQSFEEARTDSYSTVARRATGLGEFSSEALIPLLRWFRPGSAYYHFCVIYK